MGPVGKPWRRGPPDSEPGPSGRPERGADSFLCRSGLRPHPGQPHDGPLQLPDRCGGHIRGTGHDALGRGHSGRDSLGRGLPDRHLREVAPGGQLPRSEPWTRAFRSRWSTRAEASDSPPILPKPPISIPSSSTTAKPNPTQATAPTSSSGRRWTSSNEIGRTPSSSTSPPTRRTPPTTFPSPIASPTWRPDWRTRMPASTG